MLLQFSFEQVVNVGLVGRQDPAPLKEQFGQGHVLARSPERTALDELTGVDQASLQGDDAKEEIAVGIHHESPASCQYCCHAFGRYETTSALVIATELVIRSTGAGLSI